MTYYPYIIKVNFLLTDTLNRRQSFYNGHYCLSQDIITKHSVFVFTGAELILALFLVSSIAVQTIFKKIQQKN